MHIPEGLLPIDQAAGWYVPAMAFLGAGLAKLKRRLKEQPSSRPLVGLMGAFVFVVSLMPVPVPGLGLAAGLGGLAGDIVTYAITSFQLALALHGQESIAATWLAAFGSFMPTQIPLAIAELFFTSGVVVFVAKRRADLLGGLEVQP